jgi:2-methylcitrate dehydratase PrpD
MTERMQRLAQLCVDLQFEDLPPTLVAQAKRHILDTFGATLAGAGCDVAKQARQVFDGETGSALVWGTHSAIDALGMLLDQLNINADQVEDIQVSLCGFLQAMCGGREVSTQAAQMSLPYALAARLVHGHCRLEAYDEAQRGDPRIAQWMSRIRLDVDAQLSEDSEPLVSVRTVDGQQASLCVDPPLGAPGNPLSDGALEAKFFSLAVRAMPRLQAEELLEQLWRLEALESVRSLDRWLT